jgi:hypothetical protein
MHARGALIPQRGNSENDGDPRTSELQRGEYVRFFAYGEEKKKGL